MKWNEIERHWELVSPRMRRQWYRLTDVDVKRIAGKKHNLICALERRYGLSPELAEIQVQQWTARLSVLRRTGRP